MIAFIEGEVLRIGAGMLVVKTPGGIGYEVRVTQPVCASSRPFQEISLHTYTHVREEELTLYGFAVIEEKHIFEMLIKTTGVGPKMGLAILSVLSIDQLVDAVQLNNTTAFSQVPGIGKKTAAKLCLDLKDRLRNLTFPALKTGGTDFSGTHEGFVQDDVDQLVSALKNMGFSEKEIFPVLRQSGDGGLDFEGRLKKALSLLAPMR